MPSVFLSSSLLMASPFVYSERARLLEEADPLSDGQAKALRPGLWLYYSSLDGFVFGTGNQVVLEILGEIDEVGAVACHADQQAAVVFGMSHGVL